MRNVLSKGKLGIIIVIVSILSGCVQPPVISADVEFIVEEARRYFESVEKTAPNVNLVYAEDFKTARTQLVLAEKLLKKGPEEDIASAANESIKASLRILQQFAEQQILPEARKLYAHIEAKQIQDPDSPFIDILAQVGEVISAGERIAKHQESIQVEDLEKIAGALPFLEETADTVNKALTETLESDDVSFDKGEYELTEQGRQKLRDGFVNRFSINLKTFMQKYAGRPFIITIKTVGYTDEQGFSLQTKQRLLENIAPAVTIPQGAEEERKFLNQVLSQLRAQSINDYLKYAIAQTIGDEEVTLSFEQQPIGKGETIPPNVLAPYPTDDSRRRICKLFSYVRVE